MGPLVDGHWPEGGCGDCVWFIGRRLIRVAVTILGLVLDRRSLDPTVVNYLRSGLAFAVLGLFNIAPTTVAALMAGVGLATMAGVTGPVLKDIGGFTTTIDTP